MRVSSTLLIVSILLPAPALAANTPDKHAQAAASTPDCPRVSSYVADKIGAYRGQRLTPKKLAELPPATTYMAVYREIGGCEAPLTMSAYRHSEGK